MKVGLAKSAALAAVCDFGTVAAEHRIPSLPAALNAVDQKLDQLIQAVRDDEAAKHPVAVSKVVGHA